MSTQRFAPEFKEEAVKQVVERGYGVPDVRRIEIHRRFRGAFLTSKLGAAGRRAAWNHA